MAASACMGGYKVFLSHTLKYKSYYNMEETWVQAATQIDAARKDLQYESRCVRHKGWWSTLDLVPQHTCVQSKLVMWPPHVTGVRTRCLMDSSSIYLFRLIHTCNHCKRWSMLTNNTSQLWCAHSAVKTCLNCETSLIHPATCSGTDTQTPLL